MKKPTRQFAEMETDRLVSELHRLRREMFEESGGNTNRYVETVRAAAAQEYPREHALPAHSRRASAK